MRQFLTHKRRARTPQDYSTKRWLTSTCPVARSRPPPSTLARRPTPQRRLRQAAAEAAEYGKGVTTRSPPPFTLRRRFPRPLPPP